MDLLVEDPELVADSVTHRGALEGGQRVEIAGGESAEAAVAQAGLLLAGQHVVVVLAHLGQGRSDLVLDAEVEQVVTQVRPEQELRGEVDGNFAAEVQVGLCGLGPALLHAVPDCQGQRVIVVLRRAQRRGAAQRVAQMVFDRLPQRRRTHPGPDVIVGMIGTVPPGCRVPG